MNAAGRILTAARWISGANGTLGGAAGTTGLGYGKSKWQRATEANRAVEYAIKGVVILRAAATIVGNCERRVEAARARARHQGGTRGAGGRLEPACRRQGRTRTARGAQRPYR